MSVLGSVLERDSEVYLGAYSEVYLGAYSEVYLGVSSELTWERTVKQAGSMLSSAIRSVSSRLGVCNRVRSGVYFCAYLGAYNEVHLVA
jgi:hypothetical protein